MTDEALIARLGEDARLVEKTLLSRADVAPCLAILENDPTLRTLRDAENYSLTAGGKRIRPALTIECCRMLGGKIDGALPLAAAVEMIHTYSLIHDDLPCMDNDDLRRGKPTNHKVFGEGMATLAGDGLLTDAFSMVACDDALAEPLRLEAVRLLAAAAGSAGMVGGQEMDLEGENRKLPLSVLEKLHARKTGAMILVSAQLGAVAAGMLPDGDADAPFARLSRYAEDVGLAFQIVDDLLDVSADPQAMGKTLGKDAAENKTTFLSYYSVDEARDFAHKLTDRACRAVEPFDKDGVLSALARYLAARNY